MAYGKSELSLNFSRIISYVLENWTWHITSRQKRDNNQMIVQWQFNDLDQFEYRNKCNISFFVLAFSAEKTVESHISGTMIAIWNI